MSTDNGIYKNRTALRKATPDRLTQCVAAVLADHSNDVGCLADADRVAAMCIATVRAHDAKSPPLRPEERNLALQLCDSADAVVDAILADKRLEHPETGALIPIGGERGLAEISGMLRDALTNTRKVGVQP